MKKKSVTSSNSVYFEILEIICDAAYASNDQIRINIILTGINDIVWIPIISCILLTDIMSIGMPIDIIRNGSKEDSLYIFIEYNKYATIVANEIYSNQAYTLVSLFQ